MAFPAILAAFLQGAAGYAGARAAGSIFGGPEQPPISLEFPTRRAGGLNYLPLPTINTPPVGAPPVEPLEPLPEPEEPGRTQRPGQRITDAFLKSLMESLAQRIVSGGGGGGQTFTPAVFR